MIEELRDYLVRHGWDEDIADEVHDLYVETSDEDFEGALRTWASDNLDDIEHDYGSEIYDLVMTWRREVGEL